MFSPLIEALFSTFESETVGFPQATIGSSRYVAWMVHPLRSGNILGSV